MLELGRLRALLAVVGGMGGGLALVDELVRRGAAGVDEWLMRAEHVDPSRRVRLGRRVAAVEAAPPPHLGVVLGFSTAREGIDPLYLEAHAPPGKARRWLNLASSGGSFFELEQEVRPLLRSTLRPEQLLLAVHPVWLAGRVDSRKKPSGASALLARREWLRLSADRLLLDEKERAVLASGSGLGELYPPAAEPYGVLPLYRGRSTEAHRAQQLEAWTAFRWFDSTRYGDAGARLEADALVATLRALAEQCPDVRVLMMPEASTLRERVPAEAITAFVEALGHGGHPRVLDLRAALPDELFHDHAHLDERGREKLSERLSEELSKD